MKKITMQTIADELGISKMTVSKAFSGSTDIQEETKNKILLKAKELGYKYNKDKNSNILVLASEIFLQTNEEFYSGLYKKINEVFSIHNYLLSLTIVKKDELETYLRKLKFSNYDSIIILGQLPKEFIENLKEIGKPLLCIDFYYRGLNVDTIYSDNFNGSYEITSHLIDKGYRKIGFVGRLNSTSSINDRFFGYLKALLENNIEYTPKYIYSDREENNELVEVEFNEDLPKAFVCNNDHTAYLLINKLKEKGYNIPKDIAVVGFDDVIYSTISDPQITTMRVHRNTMAETAYDLIIRRLKNPNAPIRNLKIECQLIERKSA